MIERVVFVPQPLFLLPEYRGRLAPAPDLTAAAVEAVSRLALADRIVVITGQPPVPGHPRGTGRAPAGVRVARELLAAAGVTQPVEEVLVPFDLPTDACLEQGRALAARAGAVGVVDGAGASVDGAGGRGGSTGLLVMADGSARRGEKAPGYVDDRALAYDDTFVTALERGRPHDLAGLDAPLAAALLFQGRAALQVAAGAVGQLSPSPIMIWRGDPFGVMYVVAEWVIR